ncbi:hypothetical protein [Modestobacter sp. VKM Ac-2978]|uniref:hypothetical protein n=1 Tax=Modestobacter sp. VKM Ac-2978 TaxID=3004132 RepID=UPI0022AA4762|nr:hypothetical protein [Modestobacter sp. VKM Ac-2978]MCZ2848086.1 hypothetical protein [Modestobacter sp. VKM Ac-2978]
MLELWRNVVSFATPREMIMDNASHVVDPMVGVSSSYLMHECGDALEGLVRLLRREPRTSPDDLRDLISPLARDAQKYLQEILRGYRQQLTTKYAAEFEHREVEETARQLERAIDNDVATRAAQEARQAASTAQAAASSSRQAAGVAGSTNLAVHFEEYRKSERTQAEVLRVLAVVLVLGALVILGFLFRGEPSATEVAQRAIFALPAFGVAAYLAAEAGRHRRASQWAATLKVQLLTVDAYVQPLGEKEAAEVRQLLARRAFGELPVASGGSTSEDAPMPLGLQAVLDRILSEVKAKPEKP